MQQWVFVLLIGESGIFSSDSCSLHLSRWSQLEAGERLFVRRVIRWEGLRTRMGLYKQNLGSGAVQLEGWSLTSPSNWCGLLLSIEQRFLFWNYIFFLLRCICSYYYKFTLVVLQTIQTLTIFKHYEFKLYISKRHEDIQLILRSITIF